MKKINLTLLILCFTIGIHSQNLFPVLVKNCTPDLFCLDCGEIKANFDESKMDVLVENLIKKNNINGIEGTVMFQILIDSTGKGCVLSHSDGSKSQITKSIISALNNFDGFIPPKTKDKIEVRTSINMSFKIKNGKIIPKIDRIDMEEFKKSFDRPQNPEIYNKKYVYKNINLNKYKITVWNSKNSNLPNNVNDNISIDTNGLIWLSIDEGLVTFDGKEFKNTTLMLTDKEKCFNFYSLTTDNNNVKWASQNIRIYSFDNSKWTTYDSTEIGIKGAYEIINNPKTGEVFFCSDEGLKILKDGKWSTINKNNFKELPSNRVTFAKRDSKNRIWIGTFSGSAMIDENNQMTNFENTKIVLKGKCITSMDEDENGNLYFTLFEFDRKEKTKVSNDEGIAIRYSDGKFKQFTTENSGMPFNHANCVLYDRYEKVLWISTERAGLVRYDLKDGWENYHNENSDIPTSYISTMTFDANGILYLATRQGLVKIERK